MRQISTRAFGATGLKYTLAGLFMVAAVGVLGWRLIAQGDAEPRAARSRPVAITPEGDPIDTNYTRVRNRDDAREAVAMIGQSVARNARSVEELGELTPEVYAQVGDAVVDSIGSFFDGKYEDFLEAMRRMGAELDPEADYKPLYDRFRAWCALGEPDLDRLEVRRYVPMSPAGDPGGAQGPRRVMRTQDEDSGGEPRRGVGVRQMRMSTESMFPAADVEGESSRAPIEVIVPVRPRSGPSKGGEITLGVVLVWNDEAGYWQPGAYSKTTYSIEEDD